VDASSLWGKDTWTTQQTIWDQVKSGIQNSGWTQLGSSLNSGRTTQNSAVACIGPLGEAKAGELGSIIHDAGCASGQGGFGAVWGSKNLKAISVLGSGNVSVADPKALLAAWQWSKGFMPVNFDAVDATKGLIGYASSFGPTDPTKTSAPMACMGCPKACHGRRFANPVNGWGSESHCVLGTVAQPDTVQKWGANAYAIPKIWPYLVALNKAGFLGPGMTINSTLPFDQLTKANATVATMELFLNNIVTGKDIGLDLRDGMVRAAQKWGRLDQDWKSGLLNYPYWGYQEHMYDGRVEVEWGYGTILGDRDINEHMIAWRIYFPLVFTGANTPSITAQEAANIFAEKVIPYQGDPHVVDYSDANIYSDPMVKLVAWHRHYTSFFQESLLFCDFMWPDTINPYGPNNRGMTPDGEPKFYNAVTGKNLAFTDGMEIGRKIWNLRNAIWTLQGRTRDMAKFADYYYDVPYASTYKLTGYQNGAWGYYDYKGRKLDRTSVEDFKTKFYKLEGWDTTTGWPTRATLEGLGLKNVADTLQAKGKLGSSS
jgi:aldehyde:ferredoxin oxidoreductase